MKNAETAAGRLWNTITFNTTQEKFSLVKINELVKERVKLQNELAELSFGPQATAETPDQSAAIDPDIADPDVVDPNANAIQAITDRFKTEEELLISKLERELEIVGENDLLKEELHQEYLENILNMEEDSAHAQDAINKKADKDKLKGDRSRHKSEQSMQLDNISSLMAITSALVGHNDKVGKALFIGAQALAASQVFFNTQAAAARALAELGPIAGPPVAAGIQTSGTLQIAAIAATTLGSMSSGGGSGGGSSSVATSPPAQDFQQETASQEVSTNIVGDESSTNVQTVTFNSDGGSAADEFLSMSMNEAQRRGSLTVR